MTTSGDETTAHLRNGVAQCPRGRTETQNREAVLNFVLENGAMGAKASQVARRLGLPLRTVQYQLNHLVASHEIVQAGRTNGTIYFGPGVVPSRHAKFGIHRVILLGSLLRDGGVGAPITQEVLNYVKGRVYRYPTKASGSGFEWDQGRRWKERKGVNGAVWFEAKGCFHRWTFTIKFHPSNGTVMIEVPSSEDPFSPTELHELVGYLRGIFPWIEPDEWEFDHPELNVDVHGIVLTRSIPYCRVDLKVIDTIFQVYPKGENWTRKEVRLAGRHPALLFCRMLMMEAAAINGTDMYVNWPESDSEPEDTYAGYA